MERKILICSLEAPSINPILYYLREIHLDKAKLGNILPKSLGKNYLRLGLYFMSEHILENKVPFLLRCLIQIYSRLMTDYFRFFRLMYAEQIQKASYFLGV